MASAGKVLILVENLSVPFDRRVWQEATALVRSGWRVSVICPRMVDRKPHEILDGVSIYRYPMVYTARRALGYIIEYPWAMLFSLLYTTFIFMRNGTHILHACNPPDLFFLISFPFKVFGAKFLFDQHDLCPETFLSKYHVRHSAIYKILLFLEACTYKTANVVISTNHSYRKLAMKRGKIPAERIWVVRSAPDLTRFKLTEQVPKLKRGKPYLVSYLGTMGQQDGIDYLLRSIRIIVHEWKRADIHFVLMGGGENLDFLRKMAFDMGLDEVVEFTGRISDELVCEILSTTDVCVAPDPINPLNNMSTMNKILEFMAMSKPIVSFRLAESFFSAGEAALYPRDNDEEDFAQKIIDLLSNPILRDNMGKLGYNRLKNKLSWDQSTSELLSAYKYLQS